MITIRNTQKTGSVYVPPACTGTKGGCVLTPGEQCDILDEKRKDICGPGISVIDPRTNEPVDVELKRAERQIESREIHAEHVARTRVKK
jgi:hypothetical protein